MDLVLLDRETETPLIIRQKLFMWETVIILGKVLFKNSLIVQELCLLIRDISFFIQIAMWSHCHAY